MLTLTSLKAHFSHMVNILRQVSPDVPVSLNAQNTYTCRVSHKDKNLRVQFLLKKNTELHNGSPFVHQKTKFPVQKSWAVPTHKLAESSSDYVLGNWVAFGVQWKLKLLNDAIGNSFVEICLDEGDDFRQGRCHPTFQLLFKYKVYPHEIGAHDEHMFYSEIYLGNQRQQFLLLPASKKIQWLRTNKHKSHFSFTFVFSILYHPQLEAAVGWRKEIETMASKNKMITASLEKLTEENLSTTLDRIVTLKEKADADAIKVEESYLSVEATLSFPESLSAFDKNTFHPELKLLRHRGLVPLPASGALPWEPASARPALTPVLESLLELGFLLIDERSLFLYFLAEALGKDPSQEFCERKKTFRISHSYPLQQEVPASQVSIQVKEKLPSSDTLKAELCEKKMTREETEERLRLLALNKKKNEITGFLLAKKTYKRIVSIKSNDL